MTDIKDAFLEQGLDPGQITLDGKIHRFKVSKEDSKNSGWYLGFQNHTVKSGETFQVVVFGNYRTGETFNYKTGSVKYSAADNAIIAKQMSEAKKKQEELIKAGHEEASREVNEEWTKLLDVGDSAYLRLKQIYQVKGLGIKYDERGSIYIPLRDVENKLWSWEKIQWDNSKWFYSGGRKRGCFHTLGNIAGAETIYITEGFATGASVHLATGEATVVAFDSGNLLEVAIQLKKLYADKSFIVCGDDDRDGKKQDGTPNNVGKIKAEEAAARCLGRAVFPIFKSYETKPTDFNDLHAIEGIERVAEQLGAVEPAPKLALYALGFSGGEYFFTSTQNRQIVGVTAFSEDNLIKLMPLNYWQAVFPAQGERGNGIAWSEAKSQLIAQCQEKGIFDASNVRGAGVWMDRGRIVVNMGDHLIIDGVRANLGTIKSRFFYSLGKNLEQLRIDPLEVSECKILIDACKLFRWARPKDAGILLAGALVTNRVCGALPYRPHCWITGGAQTGKTTLFERLVNPIMGRNRLYFLGGTTEAGVRQALKSDALPIMFDEFESNGGLSNEKIASCIELMRASWAESGGAVVKGGATGNASYYQLRFSAIVSSIRTRLINDADRGRFAVLELSPHGGDETHWKELSGLLAQIDDDFAERLFARSIKMLPLLLNNFKLLKTALAKRADSRFGDQYGMLLAGYSILLTDEPLDLADAEIIAENVELSEEKEVAKAADQDDALAHLLTTKVNFGSGSTRQDSSIGTLIDRAKRRKDLAPGLLDDERNALLMLGIRVDPDSVAIISTNHAELERLVWRGTKWSQIWGNTLARLHGAEKKRVRIGGPPCWAVVVPIDTFSN
jgi:putative DNA primase/helicase